MDFLNKSDKRIYKCIEIVRKTFMRYYEFVLILSIPFGN